MLKKLALAAFLFLFAGPVLAANCGGYSFTLTNGQIADANQVMANFNSILACVNGFTTPNLPLPLSTFSGGTGNSSGTIGQLTTGQTISMTGDVAFTTGAFDGTGPVTGVGTIQPATVTGSKIAAATITTSNVAASTLTNSNLATMSDQTFKGNVSGGAAVPSDLTVTQMAAALSGQTSTTVANGADARFSALPQGSHSAAYGILLADAGLELYHPSADTTARIWTIPANASVAFPVATKIEIVNDCSAGILTVAITSDTLEWFPAGTTGSRSIAACGMATLTKITTTKWVITGVNVSLNGDWPGHANDNRFGLGLVRYDMAA